MKLISFATKLLHVLPGELSHYLALKSLKILHTMGFLGLLLGKNHNSLIKHKNSDASLNIENLKNRVGFAAGLDKDGEYIDSLAALGVGFIEVGTVTPRAQSGNARPRLFRNRKEKSLLNRLGFNNKGVDHLVKRLKKRKTKIAIGVSIGKNFDTPNEDAYKDYTECMRKVYEFCDYIAINISSPNTENLRTLSKRQFLDSLLSKLKLIQSELSINFGYKPLYLKISPDENTADTRAICDSILENKIDGIICSNTSIDHDNLNGKGGISGSLLKDKSTNKLILVKTIIGDSIPIMASGGVMSVKDFQEKITHGADFVQVYTGFIFEGPKLISDILKSENL